MHYRELCLASVVLLYSCSAEAQSLNECGQIKDNAVRLECFDKIPKAQPQPSKWKISETTSDLDRSRVVSISLDADKTRIGRGMADQPWSFLLLRCRERKTELTVVFSSTVGAGIRPIKVDYRIGSSKPVTTAWDVSQDRKAYGPWDKPVTIPIVKEMMNSDELFVRGNDEHYGTTEALFKLAGLAEAVKPIRETCKW